MRMKLSGLSAFGLQNSESVGNVVHLVPLACQNGSAYELRGLRTIGLRKRKRI